MSGKVVVDERLLRSYSRFAQVERAVAFFVVRMVIAHRVRIVTEVVMMSMQITIVAMNEQADAFIVVMMVKLYYGACHKHHRNNYRGYLH